MKPINRADLLVIRMGLDALLMHVRQSEAWWRAYADGAALLRTRQLESAINQTRRKFFTDESASDVHSTEAMIVAEGLRDAARHCTEGQAALQARLMGASEVIERLCRLCEVQP